MMKPVSSLSPPTIHSEASLYDHRDLTQTVRPFWGEVWDLFITLVLYQSIRKILRKSLFAS